MRVKETWDIVNWTSSHFQMLFLQISLECYFVCTWWVWSVGAAGANCCLSIPGFPSLCPQCQCQGEPPSLEVNGAEILLKSPYFTPASPHKLVVMMITMMIFLKICYLTQVPSLSHYKSVSIVQAPPYDHDHYDGDDDCYKTAPSATIGQRF